jgi:hypothetical protein
VRRRVYIDGIPSWEDEGPGAARLQGYAGEMVVAPETKPPAPKDARCLQPMRGELVCGRRLGHGTFHASFEAFERRRKAA